MPAVITPEDEEGIQRLRDYFVENFAEKEAGGKYDSRDIERVKTDDLFIKAFYIHKQNMSNERGKMLQHRINLDAKTSADRVTTINRNRREDLKKASEMMHESLAWRNSIGIHDITFSEFEPEALQMAAIFFYGHDVDGNDILWFRVRLQKKDKTMQTRTMRLVAYILEQHHRTYPLETLCIVFDLTGAGMSNIDMETLRFQINCFLTYFPAMLNVLINYDMPWLLNSVWSIVKTWLPPAARERVKFLKKDTLNENVSPENAFTHMGGTQTLLLDLDNYIEEFAIDGRFYRGTGNIHQHTGHDIEEARKSKMNGTVATSNGYIPHSKSEPYLGKSREESVSIVESIESEAPSLQAESPDSESKPHGESTISVERVKFSADTIVFARPTEAAANSALLGRITLSNISATPVAFKVKVTKVQLFKAYPSYALLNPGKSVSIEVSVNAGQSVDKEKVLILVHEGEELADLDVATITSAQVSAQPEILKRVLQCRGPSGADLLSYASGASRPSVMTVVNQKMPPAPNVTDTEKMLRGIQGCQRRLGELEDVLTAASQRTNTLLLYVVIPLLVIMIALLFRAS